MSNYMKKYGAPTQHSILNIHNFTKRKENKSKR